MSTEDRTAFDASPTGGRLGIPLRDMESALGPVRDPAAAGNVGNAGDEVEEAFARAAWSGIAEPGDAVAGVLVGALGAVEALRLVIDHTTDSTRGRAAAAVLSRSEERPAPTPTLFDDPEQSSRALVAALQRWRPRLESGAVFRSLRLAKHAGAVLLLPGDADWPTAVDDLGAHAPLALWRRGRPLAETAANAIAVVGARAATGYGEHVTVELTAGLVDRGFGIVSGAAYGIDGIAHRTALATGGATVAVLAGGVDRHYPSGHDVLLARIANEGTVLAEPPCGSPPTKWRFLQRNRLISALGLATVVCEAGHRSGSLNTAGHAAALGRPLGAVPGPITSAASAGCHRLLREYDAVCIRSADDVAELTRPGDGGGGDPVSGASPTDRARPEGVSDDEPDTIRLRDALSTRSFRAVDDLAARSGLAPAIVAARLGLLALDGRAEERSGQWRMVARR